MNNQDKRKYVNNAVFILVIIVSFFIISLICITDCCMIKSNCNQYNTQDTTALYQKSVEIDSSSKTIQFFSNNSNRTTAKTDTVITTQEKNTTSTSTNNPASLDSIVFNLTLAVNAINNVLSGGAIALGILTLFIGLVGLFGFNTLKDDIREYKDKHDRDTKEKNKDLKIRLTKAFNEFSINQNTRLETFNNTINEYTKEVDRYTHQIDDVIRESQAKQARYFNQTLNFLYQVIYSNIEQMDDHTQAEQLLVNLFHELQIARLYRNSLDENGTSNIDINIIAALEYFENNGRIEDIPHLEYIAKNDPNEKIRDRAKRIIGRIEERGHNRDNEKKRQNENQGKASDANNITNKYKPKARVKQRKKRR